MCTVVVLHETLKSNVRSSTFNSCSAVIECCVRAVCEPQFTVTSGSPLPTCAVCCNKTPTRAPARRPSSSTSLNRAMDFFAALTQFQGECAAVQAKADKRGEEVQALRALVKGLEGEINRLRREAAAAEAAAAALPGSSVAETAARAEAVNAALHTQLAVIATSMGSQAADFRANAASLRRSAAAAGSTVDAYAATAGGAYDAAVQRAATVLADTDDALATLRGEHAALEDDVRAQEDKTAALTEQLDSAVALVADGSTALAAQKDAGSTSLAALRAEHAALETLRATAAAAGTELAAATDARDAALKRRDATRNRRDALRRRLGVAGGRH